MSDRPETGRMQFADDWPGVFIRGDTALSYARVIQELISDIEKRAPDLSPEDISRWARMRGLAQLLESCRVDKRTGDQK